MFIIFLLCIAPEFDISAFLFHDSQESASDIIDSKSLKSTPIQLDHQGGSHISILAVDNLQAMM